MFSYRSKIKHVYIDYILKKFLKSCKKYYMLVNLYLQKKITINKNIKKIKMHFYRYIYIYTFPDKYIYIVYIYTIYIYIYIYIYTIYN